MEKLIGECMLCKRDMKVSNTTFGKGCERNIYKIFIIMTLIHTHCIILKEYKK